MSQTIEYFKSQIELYDKPEDNHALGMLYFKNGSYIDGLAYTKRAIENDPYQKVYWQDYVSILEKLNLSLEASYILGIYTKFIEKDSKLNEKLEALKSNSAPNQNIVPTNEITQIVNLLEKLNPADFIKECNLFIKRYPLVSIGYLLSAFAKIKMKRFQDARNLCLIANAIEPENSEVLLKLGDVYRALKNYEKGYECYKRGLEISGDNHHLLNNLSVLLNQWGKPEEALNYNTALLKLKPNDRNALFNKAISLSKLRKTDDALDCYEKIIQTYPSFRNAFINKASLYSDLKNYPAAISTLNQLVQLDAKNQTALQNLASNYNKNREIDLAIKTYRKLLHINSSHIPALINLGIILKNIGEIDEAIELFENALLINDKLPHAYNNLSGCYLIKENFKKAEEMVNEALKLDENFADALINYLNLIRVYNPESTATNISQLNKKVSLIADNFAFNKKLEDKKVIEFIEAIRPNIQEFTRTFSIGDQQVMIRNDKSLHLDCGHRMDLFNNLNIISEFCMTCYKIQITVPNLLNLIKLLLIMKKHREKFGPLMKCMVETRANISGKFKGFIYFRSKESMSNHITTIEDILAVNGLSDFTIITKRGCSEFYSEYPNYKNINSNFKEIYLNRDWQKKESDFRQRVMDLRYRSFHTTNKNFNLFDGIIIENWLQKSPLI